MQNENLSSAAKGYWFKDLAAIFILFSVLYLGLAFLRPLASPDEGRYGEIPREMAVSGDWVTPRLNGMQYFYKPPMCYWLGAVAVKTCGVNRISVRLPNSLMAVIGVCAAYCAARALYGRRQGIVAACVLATSVLYFALGEIVTLDMTVSVFISMALFCFIVALKRSGIWRGILILLFCAFCAFAVLTKGLIGILIPCAIVFFYAFAYGIFSFFKTLKWSDLAWALAGVVLFAAIAVPWHVMAAIANPAYESAEGVFSKNWEGQGFFWYYIIHEHILRYVDAETSMRAKPFWFFFVLAPVGFIPWLFLLPQAVWDEVRGGWKSLRDRNPEFIFFAVWTMFIILFFSISKSKLPPYILPIYPALAVMVAPWIVRVWQNPQQYSLKVCSWLFIGGGYALCIAAPILYAIQNHKGKITDHNAAIITFSIFAIAMFVTTTIALYRFLKGGVTHKFMISVYVAVLTLFVCFNPVGVFVQRPSAQPLVEQIMQERNAGDVVVVAYDYGAFQDLPVWLGELPIMFGEPPEEQKFGFMREREIHKDRFLSTPESIANFVANRRGAIFIAVKNEAFYLLEKLNLPMKKIGSNGELLLYKIDARK